MFKKIFEFAFQNETIDILNDLKEVKESAINAWEQNRYVNCVLMWIIYVLFMFVALVISACELAIMGVWTTIRGVVLVVFALVGELIAIGIR